MEDPEEALAAAAAQAQEQVLDEEEEPDPDLALGREPAEALSDAPAQPRRNLHQAGRGDGRDRSGETEEDPGLPGRVPKEELRGERNHAILARRVRPAKDKPQRTGSNLLASPPRWTSHPAHRAMLDKYLSLTEQATARWHRRISRG